MNMKRKRVKRVLAVVLVMTILVGLFNIPAFGATGNDSLDAVVDVATSGVSANLVEALDLRNKDIYGDVDITKLKTQFPNLKLVKLDNTNVTKVTPATGVTVTDVDTFAAALPANRRGFVASSTISYNESDGDLSVAKLMEKVKIKTASGALVNVPVAILDRGTIKINTGTPSTSSTHNNVDVAGVINKADIKAQSGIANIELDFPILFSTAGSLKITSGLKLDIVKEYSITPNPGMVYDGGSAYFTFKRADSNGNPVAVSESDFDFKLESSSTNKLLSEVTAVSGGFGLRVKVTAEDINVVNVSTGSTSANLTAYDKSNKALVTANVVKATNPAISKISLKEYYFNKATGVYQVAVGGNIALNTFIPGAGTVIDPAKDKMIYVAGGTGIASADKTNIAPNLQYSATTKFLLLDDFGAYIPANYESQIEVKTNYPDSLRVDLETVADPSGKTNAAGEKEMVLAVSVTAKAVNGDIFRHNHNSVDQEAVTINLKNAAASGVGDANAFFNVQAFANTVTGIRIYQVPAVYRSMTTTNLENAIINDDSNIKLVGEYEKPVGGGAFVPTANNVGAHIVEDETAFFVAAAFYGDSSQNAYVIDTNNINGWYYDDVTPPNQVKGKDWDTTATPPTYGGANTGKPTEITHAGDATAIKAFLDRNDSVPGLPAPPASEYTAEFSKNSIVLELAAGKKADAKADAEIVFAYRGTANNVAFPITIDKATVKDYVIAPEIYLTPTWSVTNPVATYVPVAPNAPTLDYYQMCLAAETWEVENGAEASTMHLYRLNVLGEDNIAMGGTNDYQVIKIMTNGKEDSSLTAVDKKVKLQNQSIVQKDLFKVVAGTANGYEVTVEPDGGKKDALIGESTEMLYIDAGVESKVIKLTITGSDIIGTYIVLKDHMGHYYTNDKDLAANVDSIDIIPDDGFEIPEGTDTSRISVLYKFTNKTFYKGMTEAEWKTYRIDTIEGASTNLTLMAEIVQVAGGSGNITIDHAGSLKEAIIETSTAPAGVGDIDDFIANLYVGESASGVEIDTAVVNGTTYKLDLSGTYISSMSDPLSNGNDYGKYEFDAATEEAKVVIVDPVVVGIAANMPSANNILGGGPNNPVDNQSVLVRDNTVGSVKNFIPGDGEMTKPTVTLSNGGTNDYTSSTIDGDGKWTAVNAGKWNITDPFLQSSDGITMVFADDAKAKVDDARDPYRFVVTEHDDTGTIPFHYEYQYTLNGKELATPIKLKPSAGMASTYELNIQTGKASAADIYLVSETEDLLDIKENIYTRPFKLADTFRVYPVAISESVQYDVKYDELVMNPSVNPIPPYVTMDDVDQDSTEYYNQYLSYVTLKDFDKDTIPEKLYLQIIDETGAPLTKLPDGKLASSKFAVDADGRVYYEFLVNGMTFENERVLMTFDQDGTKPGAAPASTDLKTATTSQFESYLPLTTPMPNASQELDLQFFHLAGKNDVNVVDITANIDTVTTPPIAGSTKNYAAGDKINVAVEYSLSADVKDETGAIVTTTSDVNPEYFDYLNDKKITVMPGSKLYPTSNPEANANVLVYDVDGPVGNDLSVSYDETKPGLITFKASIAGEYKIQLYTINNEGTRAPYFDPRYREVSFIIEPKHEPDVTIYYGEEIDVPYLYPAGKGYREAGTTKHLDATSVAAGKLKMANNANGTTKVEIFDADGNAICDFNVKMISTIVKAAKLNVVNGTEGTSADPKAMINGEARPLYWIVDREASDLSKTFTVNEPVGASSWTKVHPFDGSDRAINFDGKIMTVKATDSGLVAYNAVYDASISQQFWADVDATKTATYNYAFSTSDTDKTQVVTKWDAFEADTKTLYIWDLTTDALIGNIYSMSNDDASVAQVVQNGTNALDLTALTTGTSKVTVYPDAGGFIELPISVTKFVVSYVIDGSVVDKATSPIIGATVTLTDASNAVIDTADTDSLGAYQFTVTADDTYKVTASAAGYQDNFEDVIVAGADVTANTIVLDDAPLVGYKVTGIVVDISGTAIAGADVELNGATTTTDANGAYEFTNVYNGSHDVKASMSGYQDGKVNARVANADVVAGDIVLLVSPPAVGDYKVTGKVVDESNAPLAGVTVTITKGSDYYVGTTDVNGDYVIEDVVAGAFKLIAEMSGYSDETADITIVDTDIVVPTITMKAVEEFAVEVISGENGTATVDKATAYEGSKVTITAKPDTNYRVDKVTAVDKDGKAVTVTEIKTDESYTIVMPAADVTINVTFKYNDKHPCASSDYVDLKLGDWFHQYVDYVLENNIMAGTGQSPLKFDPTSSLSRAQMVQILFNVEGKPTGSSKSGFKDIPADAWFEEAVDWAKATGVAAGYPEDNTYRPNQLLTREEMVVILRNYADYKKFDVTASADLGKFKDAGQVSSWAKSAMQWAVANEFITGRTTDTIVPRGTSIRAEVAVVITKLCRFYEVF